MIWLVVVRHRVTIYPVAMPRAVSMAWPYTNIVHCWTRIIHRLFRARQRVPFDGCGTIWSGRSQRRRSSSRASLERAAMRVRAAVAAPPRITITIIIISTTTRPMKVGIHFSYLFVVAIEHYDQPNNQSTPPPGSNATTTTTNSI